MRKILSFLTISLLVFFASCDLNQIPEFDDSNVFVAFDNSGQTISERGKTLLVPVTLASIKGMTETVSFSVTDGTTNEKDKPAKVGVNYRLVNESTSLTFTPEARTQYIEFEIIDIAGEFTGDLRFTVRLADDGKVKPNAESACIITITDEDHPLSFILGKYKVVANSYFDGDGFEWDMEISKDEDDVSVVWFSNIGTDGLVAGFYGVVDADNTQISLPLGQIHTINKTSSGDGNIYLYGLNAGGSIKDDGKIIFYIQDDGATLVVKEDEFGPAVNAGGGNSYFGLVFPGYTCTKR